MDVQVKALVRVKYKIQHEVGDIFLMDATHVRPGVVEVLSEGRAADTKPPATPAAAPKKEAKK